MPPPQFLLLTTEISMKGVCNSKEKTNHQILVNLGDHSTFAVMALTLVGNSRNFMQFHCFILCDIACFNNVLRHVLTK